MLLHLALGLFQSFLALIHRLCRVLDHKRLETSFSSIDRSALDAVVERETADVHALDLLLAEDVEKIALGDLGIAERWSKAWVCFDALVAAFLDDVIDGTRVELVGELATWGFFDTVIGPEGDLLLFDVFARRLRVADGVFADEGLCSRVLAGERDVVCRVGVFGGDYCLVWPREKLVDEGDDAAAVFDGECAVLWSLASV
jgi:hypothetical protein